MEQMRILYENSKLDDSKSVKGFKINKNLADAFNLLCQIKGMSNSEYIEEIIEWEIRKYLDRVG